MSNLLINLNGAQLQRVVGIIGNMEGMVECAFEIFQRYGVIQYGPIV